MGFSVSASTAIVFLAAFVSVGVLYTSAYNGFEAVGDATMDQQERALETQNTAVNVTNVTHDTSGTTDYVNVTVVNAGTSTLHVTDTDVLLNGTYRDTFAARTVTTTDGTVKSAPSETDLWFSGERLRISIHENVSEPFEVRIVTERGVSATAVVR